MNDSIRRIVENFLNSIPLMEYETMDRVLIAIENEKRIRDARKAFVESMGSGRNMTPAELEMAIVEFQRLVENSKAIKETVTGTKTKVPIAPRPVNMSQKNEAKVSGGTSGKEDDFDDLVDEIYPEV